MLAVGVERQGRLRPLLEDMAEAPAQGRTLALVGFLPKHLRAGRSRPRLVGVIGGAVVDHDHGQVFGRGTDDLVEGGRRLVGRDDRDDGVHPSVSAGDRDRQLASGGDTSIHQVSTPVSRATPAMASMPASRALSSVKPVTHTSSM